MEGARNMITEGLEAITTAIEESTATPEGIKATSETQTVSSDNTLNAESTSEVMIDAVSTVSGRQFYNHEARVKWWYIVNEQKVELLERLRGYKSFTGKKVTMKQVHQEIGNLMKTPLREFTQKYYMTSDQSKGLYGTWKKVHDNNCSKPTGSEAEAPAPDMFRGFWTSYHQSFSQCLNLSPLFRASPIETKIGEEASLIMDFTVETDENTDTNKSSKADTDDDEGEISLTEMTNKRRKPSSSRDMMCGMIQDNK
jgi:hypothetical protein